MLKSVKSHGFFEVLAPIYDTVARISMLGQYNRLRNQLLRKIDNKKGKRILDMASGTGYLAERLGHMDLVCTDISLKMLRRARTKSRGNFVLADAHRLPFKEGVFDVSVSSFAFHEVARPDEVLSEMFRSLRPGGEIAVMDVVQQNQFFKHVLLQIYHNLVELRTATYMNIADFRNAFRAAEDFNVQLEMFDLVALVWGRKKNDEIEYTI